jgi:hypothetical protein
LSLFPPGCIISWHSVHSLSFWKDAISPSCWGRDSLWNGRN